MRLPLDRLQPIGRALMLPIAVLPIAGLLLRLGQPDMLHVPFIAAAGEAIFNNLGLLFALGVAVGLARENHGAAGLAGVVCFLVATEGAKAIIVPPDPMAAGPALDAWKSAAIAKLSVPTGILAGLVSGGLYNRYSTLKAPPFLAFFEGRRFVPIAAGGAGLAGALALGYGYGALTMTFDAFRWVVTSGPLGLFLYGFMNRLLLVTGLHHIMNNIAWFIVGDFHGATGDLKRFFAGDPTAGGFMSGFFPVMMFGLPAACLAMYRAAPPERRAAVGGLLFSAALTSFLTGVTEPIEFGFVFLAPMLFAIHALLTGLAMVVMDAFGVKLGFGFSAGLVDYVLNYGLATRPLMLLPIGAAYAGIYYAVFSFAIRRFNLATPGREKDQPVVAAGRPAEDRGAAFVEALGGVGNLANIDACTTRLRLRVNDLARIDEGRLRALGAHGLLRPGGDALQVVLGPIADTVAGEMRVASHAPASSIEREQGREGARPIPPDLMSAVLPALGGEANVTSGMVRDNRLIFDLRAADRLRPDLLPSAVRAMAEPRPGVVHLLLRPAKLDDA